MTPRPTNPRVVKRIEPIRQRSFDQQFWPVLLALAVLCGMAAGAALTLLRGPWLWGSLLLLPTAAAIAIYLLYRLDDSRWRRSLQLAILISLAAHLLVLVVASFTSIFRSPLRPPPPVVAQRQPRTIEVRSRQTDFVWDQPNLQNTPEPELEVRRESTVTETKPQPVPVPPAPSVRPQPQPTRREQPAPAVPRMENQRSELRRQSRPATPQLSASSAPSAAAAEARPVTESAAATAEAAPSAAASGASRNEARESAPAQPAAASAAPSAAPSTQAAAPSATRRTAEPTPTPPAATARIRRSSPRIPQMQPSPRPTVSETPPAQPRETAPAPSATASEMTRRPSQSETPNPVRTERPRTVASPAAAVAQTAERRPQRPTISRPLATPSNPRRSSLTAQTPRTTRPVEAPSRAPRSATDARALSPRQLSVTRGTAGTAGAARDRNLNREVGGQTSPAPQASDAAAERRTRSADTAPLLTSTQPSQERRSIAQADAPSSAYRPNTINQATYSGSENLAERTLEASASVAQTSATAPAAEIAAEAGEARVDVGAMKLVAESTAERRSGGGQPDRGAMAEDPRANESRRSTERAPTLAADLGAQTVAELNPTASPPGELEPQPTGAAEIHAREGGPQPVSYDRAAAAETGPSSDAGEASVQGDADPRPRASREVPLAGGEAVEEDDPRNQPGNRSSRLAQAPRISTAVELGSGEAGGAAAPSAEMAVAEAGAAGALNRRSEGTAGAGSGRAAEAPESATGEGLAASATRRNNRNRAAGEAIASDAEATDAGRRGSRRQPRLSTAVTNPNPAGVGATAGNTAEGMGLESSPLEARRQARADGPMLEVEAAEGPAGLGRVLADRAGIPTRPASRESEELFPEVPERFRRTDSGGTPSVSPNAVVARESFRDRQPSSLGSSPPQTEAAIQLGLEFLARHQNPDGSWSLDRFDVDHPLHRQQLVSDTAATGLALLAFQGAGYTHREFKYARQIDAGLQWLMTHQDAEGGLFVPAGTASDDSCRMYSHGIATLALCEAYGMTQDPGIRSATQAAIDWIRDKRDPDRGGWRYFATPASRSTDTSVTGWMLMALQSGRLAGLNVDDATMAGIDNWLDLAADADDESRFRYNPFAADNAEKDRSGGRRPGPSMTAVGLLMRIYGGWDRDDPRFRRGAEWLWEQQRPGNNSTFERDTYYWYYATQVFKHLEGDLWEAWHGALHPLLLQTQEKSGDLAGSWDPYSPVPDRWAIHAGRLYLTTMNLLSLEVRYRLLPLYEETLAGE